MNFLPPISIFCSPSLVEANENSPPSPNPLVMPAPEISEDTAEEVQMVQNGPETEPESGPDVPEPSLEATSSLPNTVGEPDGPVPEGSSQQDLQSAQQTEVLDGSVSSDGHGAEELSSTPQPLESILPTLETTDSASNFSNPDVSSGETQRPMSPCHVKNQVSPSSQEVSVEECSPSETITSTADALGKSHEETQSSHTSPNWHQGLFAASGTADISLQDIVDALGQPRDEIQSSHTSSIHHQGLPVASGTADATLQDCPSQKQEPTDYYPTTFTHVPPDWIHSNLSPNSTILSAVESVTTTFQPLKLPPSSSTEDVSGGHLNVCCPLRPVSELEEELELRVAEQAIMAALNGEDHQDHTPPPPITQAAPAVEIVSDQSSNFAWGVETTSQAQEFQMGIPAEDLVQDLPVCQQQRPHTHLQFSVPPPPPAQLVQHPTHVELPLMSSMMPPAALYYGYPYPRYHPANAHLLPPPSVTALYPAQYGGIYPSPAFQYNPGYYSLAPRIGSTYLAPHPQYAPSLMPPQYPQLSMGYPTQEVLAHHANHPPPDPEASVSGLIMRLPNLNPNFSPSPCPNPNPNPNPCVGQGQGQGQGSLKIDVKSGQCPGFSMGLYEKYKLWQQYRPRASAYFPGGRDTDALACFLIPVLNHLCLMHPHAPLEKAESFAVNEWNKLSNSERMEYYKTAQKFLEVEQWEHSSAAEQRTEAEPHQRNSKKQPDSNGYSWKRKPQFSKSKKSVRTRGSPKRLGKAEMEKLVEGALQDYTEVMEALEASGVKDKDKSEVTEKVREEQDEMEENTSFTEYLDELCSQQEFVTQVGEVINLDYVSSLISADLNASDNLMESLIQSEEDLSERSQVPAPIVSEQPGDETSDAIFASTSNAQPGSLVPNIEQPPGYPQVQPLQTNMDNQASLGATLPAQGADPAFGFAPPYAYYHQTQNFSPQLLSQGHDDIYGLNMQQMCPSIGQNESTLENTTTITAPEGCCSKQQEQLAATQLVDSFPHVSASMIQNEEDHNDAVQQSHVPHSPIDLAEACSLLDAASPGNSSLNSTLEDVASTPTQNIMATEKHLSHLVQGVHQDNVDNVVRSTEKQEYLYTVLLNSGNQRGPTPADNIGSSNHLTSEGAGHGSKTASPMSVLPVEDSDVTAADEDSNDSTQCHMGEVQNAEDIHVEEEEMNGQQRLTPPPTPSLSPRWPCSPTLEEDEGSALSPQSGSCDSSLRPPSLAILCFQALACSGEPTVAMNELPVKPIVLHRTILQHPPTPTGDVFVHQPGAWPQKEDDDPHSYDEPVLTCFLAVGASGDHNGLADCHLRGWVSDNTLEEQSRLGERTSDPIKAKTPSPPKGTSVKEISEEAVSTSNTTVNNVEINLNNDEARETEMKKENLPSSIQKKTLIHETTLCSYRTSKQEQETVVEKPQSLQRPHGVSQDVVPTNDGEAADDSSTPCGNDSPRRSLRSKRPTAKKLDWFTRSKRKQIQETNEHCNTEQVTEDCVKVRGKEMAPEGASVATQNDADDCNTAGTERSRQTKPVETRGRNIEEGGNSKSMETRVNNPTPVVSEQPEVCDKTGATGLRVTRSAQVRRGQQPVDRCHQASERNDTQIGRARQTGAVEKKALDGQAVGMPVTDRTDTPCRVTRRMTAGGNSKHPVVHSEKEGSDENEKTKSYSTDRRVHVREDVASPAQSHQKAQKETGDVEMHSKHGHLSVGEENNKKLTNDDGTKSSGMDRPHVKDTDQSPAAQSLKENAQIETGDTRLQRKHRPVSQPDTLIDESLREKQNVQMRNDKNRANTQQSAAKSVSPGVRPKPANDGNSESHRMTRNSRRLATATHSVRGKKMTASEQTEDGTMARLQDNTALSSGKQQGKTGDPQRSQETNAERGRAERTSEIDHHAATRINADDAAKENIVRRSRRVNKDLKADTEIMEMGKENLPSSVQKKTEMHESIPCSSTASTQLRTTQRHTKQLEDSMQVGETKSECSLKDANEQNQQKQPEGGEEKTIREKEEALINPVFIAEGRQDDRCSSPEEEDGASKETQEAGGQESLAAADDHNLPGTTSDNARLCLRRTRNTRKNRGEEEIEQENRVRNSKKVQEETQDAEEQSLAATDEHDLPEGTSGTYRPHLWSTRNTTKGKGKMENEQETSNMSRSSQKVQEETQVAGEQESLAAADGHNLPGTTSDNARLCLRSTRNTRKDRGEEESEQDNSTTGTSKKVQEETQAARVQSLAATNENPPMETSSTERPRLRSTRNTRKDREEETEQENNNGTQSSKKVKEQRQEIGEQSLAATDEHKLPGTTLDNDRPHRRSTRNTRKDGGEEEEETEQGNDRTQSSKNAQEETTGTRRETRQGATTRSKVLKDTVVKPGKEEEAKDGRCQQIANQNERKNTTGSDIPRLRERSSSRLEKMQCSVVRNQIGLHQGGRRRPNESTDRKKKT